MNKKGLTWTTLVTAIIAIIVLILVVWVFREQIDAIGKQFMGIIKQTGTSGKEFNQDLGRFSEELKNLAE